MKKNGHRLSFLIVESKPGEGLSTRKLLIESARHNVLTAYSSEEGIRLFQRFPNVDVVVIDAELKGNERFARQIKEENPKMRVVCLAARIGAKASWADQTINPHDPAGLLKMLEAMGGRTDI